MAEQITAQLQKPGLTSAGTMAQGQAGQLMTGEELLAMGDTGRIELVKGEIVPMTPTGHAHGFVEIRIGKVLSIFVDDHKLGQVLGGEVGMYTGRDPDTVRAVDVAFISNERLAQVQSASYLDVAPELVVEVVSPSDAWSQLTQKLEEYFAVGVKLIWVADPERRRVHVYRSLTEIDVLTPTDELTGGEVLPGFKVAVAELFA